MVPRASHFLLWTSVFTSTKKDWTVWFLRSLPDSNILKICYSHTPLLLFLLMSYFLNPAPTTFKFYCLSLMLNVLPLWVFHHKDPAWIERSGSVSASDLNYSGTLWEGTIMIRRQELPIPLQTYNIFTQASNTTMCQAPALLLSETGILVLAPFFRA